MARTATAPDGRRDLASRKDKTVDNCAANLEVVHQLDWQRVAALLEK